MFSTPFAPFACIGDRITCTVDGVEFTARLRDDTDTHVNDFDCYTKAQKAAWSADRWMFVGVELTASKNGIDLGYLGSLWGVDCNFPSRKKNPNAYLLEVANDLLTENRDQVAEKIAAMVEALTGEGPRGRIDVLHEKLRHVHGLVTDDDTDFDEWVAQVAADIGATSHLAAVEYLALAAAE